MIQLNSFRWLLLTSLVFTSAAGHAAACGADKPNVAWAGFSLLGSATQSKSTFPFSAPHFDRMNQQLSAELKQSGPQHFCLDPETLLDPAHGRTSVTVVLENEKVSVEAIGDSYKILLGFSARVVAFDLDAQTQAVVAHNAVTMPIYIDESDRQPSQRQLAHLVQGYFFGGLDGMQTSFVSRIAQTLRETPLHQDINYSLGMGAVMIEPAAGEKFPARLKGGEAHFHFARKLSMAIASEQQVGIVPLIDNSISEMQYRFMTQDGLVSLESVNNSYLLDIVLLDLDRQKYGEVKAGSSYVYTATALVQAREVTGAADEIIFSQVMRYPVVKKVPRRMTAVDEWPVYDMAIDGLFHRFAVEVVDPSKWWRKIQGLTRNDLSEYKTLTQVLRNAR